MWRLKASKRAVSAFGRHSLREPIYALLLALTLGLPLWAQDVITLRFVDYRSGKPISGLHVLCTVWEGTSFDAPTWAGKTSTTTTSDGVTRVPLPTPLPQNLRIQAFDTVDPVSVNLALSQVLSSGVTVVANHEHNLDPERRVANAPRQVVIVTRKLGANDRMAREFP